MHSVGGQGAGPPCPPGASEALHNAISVLRRPPRDLRARHELVEVVGYGGVNVQLGAHTCGKEVLGVGDALVPEDVELANLDVGGRKPGEVLEPRGRAVGRDVGTARSGTQQGTPARDVVV